MADDPRYIRDAAGKVVGEYGANQDPEAFDRVHPVPRVDADGKPIVDGNGDPEFDMVPLHYERAQKQLAAEGLMVDPDAPYALIAIPAEDDAPADEGPAADV